jgi:DNA relaxase NicK
MFVRMYRKDLEQIQKGVPAAEVPAGWVRVELQVNNEKADALVRAIISRGMSALVEALWCALDFKDPAHSFKLATDKSKRRTVAWWHDWLEASQKLRLSVDPSIRSVEKLVGWIARSVAPALYVVSQAPSAGMGVLYALIENGGERLRQSHVAMLLADALSPSKVGYANSYCRAN